MAFSFSSSDKTAESALRRIVTELCRTILSDLKSDDRPLDLVVHDARKTVKKLRALLRLVHGKLAGSGKRMRDLRDAAALVAPLRDSDTRLATFDRLAARAKLPAASLTALRAPFETAHSAAHDVAAIGQAVSGYSEIIRDLRSRAQDWTLPRRGFSVFAPGIERAWHKAGAALVAAQGADDPEAHHLLRKRVKDIWYQTRLFAPLAPDNFRNDLERTDNLGEILGNLHDIDVLIAALPDSTGGKELAAAAQAERSTLAASALDLAGDLLAEDVPSVLDRYRTAWKSRRG